MRLKITIDGKMYDVDVDVAEDEPVSSGGPRYASRPTTAVRSAAPPSPAPGAAPAAGAPVADESKVCRAPVAGVVVKVNTHEGQQIQVNDPLLVLEAMKMETNITSPVAGKVKTINAVVGDPVQPGQVLIEFE